jgi:HPt (histidine-containing phosphotransfer) domain-containing protein
MVQATDHSAELTLNVPELLSRVDNDQELLRELLQLFKDECPRLMQSLEEAVSRQEMKVVETTSHCLKGMLANLSATRAASAASRLEELSRAGKLFELKGALADLQSEVAALRLELETCLDVKKP